MSSTNLDLARRARAVLAASVLAASWTITSSTIPAFAGQQTFSYNGAEQTFTVPTGITSLNVSLVGGKGANGSSTFAPGGFGGAGARVVADLAVTPTQVLYIEVGGNGSPNVGGFNGGGSGAPTSNSAGGGGGATDIRTLTRTDPGTLSSRLIVASGGGGGGADGNLTFAYGGNGGSRGDGSRGGYSSGGGGGFAGTSSAGGGGGSPGIGSPYYGGPGSSGSAGAGGNGGRPGLARGGGGGGGGGYFGGGGGGGSGAAFFLFVQGGGGGGGAGSSLLSGSGVTNAQESTDTTGTPQVVITWTVRPTVTSVSPSAGPVSGGSSVTITGTAFTGATAVTFGATAATSFSVNSDTSITATSPAHAPGTVHVTVTTAGGTSATGTADQFTFAPAPVVTSLDPRSGPSTGGLPVTISGSGFTGAYLVKFGSSQASSFRVVNDSTITAVTPAGLGTVVVTVTTPGGTNDPATSPTFLFVTVIPPSGPAPAPPATGRR